MQKAKRLLASLLSLLILGVPVRQVHATVVKSAPKVSVRGMAGPSAVYGVSLTALSLQSPLAAPSLNPSFSPGLGPSLPTLLIPRTAAETAPAPGASVSPAVSLPEAAPAPREANRRAVFDGKDVPAAAAPEEKFSAVAKIKPALHAVTAWTGNGAKRSLSPEMSLGSLSSAGSLFWDAKVSKARTQEPAATGSWGAVSGRRAAFRLGRAEAANAADVPESEPKAPELSRTTEKKPFYRQLWFWIAASLVTGAGTGLLLNAGLTFLPAASASVVSHVGTTAISGAAWWGDVFMKALRWMAGPLVFASVASAIGGHENPKEIGGLFPRVLGYYLFTTVVSVGIGLGLALLIQPGSFFPAALLEQFAGQAAASVTVPPSIWAVLAGIVPRSLQEAGMAFINVNALQIVFMALTASAATITARAMQFKNTPALGRVLKGAASRFIAAMSGLQQFVMALISGKKVVLKSGRSFFLPGLMHTAPIAVFGLLGRLTSDMGFAAFSGLGAYIGTVLLGLALLVVFYSGLIKFWGKRSPVAFLKDSANAALTGFSTASSAATIPVSLETAIEKHKISKPIAKLMITMGSAMNMEGTALYQVIALLFLAQVFGIALTPVTTAMIIGTLLLSSLGTPGSPGAGMAILTSIAISLGIPPWGTALLLSVDRPLDMSRTAINVLGDQTSALIIDEVDKKRNAAKK